RRAREEVEQIPVGSGCRTDRARMFVSRARARGPECPVENRRAAEKRVEAAPTGRDDPGQIVVPQPALSENPPQQKRSSRHATANLTLSTPATAPGVFPPSHARAGKQLARYADLGNSEMASSAPGRRSSAERGRLRGG